MDSSDNDCREVTSNLSSVFVHCESSARGQNKSSPAANKNQQDNCNMPSSNLPKMRPFAASTGQVNGTTLSSVPTSPQTHKVIESIRFVAAHLKNDEDYAEVLILYENCPII